MSTHLDTTALDVDAANATAFARLDAADPWVIDVAPAREVGPGFATTWC